MRDQVFSKVILCGEHSVLRGGMAVVAPLKTYSLTYDIDPSESFKLTYSEKTAHYEILIEGTFEKALSLLGKSKEDLRVNLNLETLVPLGKGLGGSAALCVFVSRVMVFLDFMDEDRVFSFSIELENMFHGESSGVDIAGCLSSGPKSYVRGQKIKAVESKLTDCIFGLIETGEVGETEECIENILKLKRDDKNLFYSLDADMDKASKGILKGLEEGNKNLLVESFDLGNSVFKSWNLVTPKMNEKLTEALKAGALAVKPTGSGMGGYLLSVWDKQDEKKALKICSELFVL